MRLGGDPRLCPAGDGAPCVQMTPMGKGSFSAACSLTSTLWRSCRLPGSVPVEDRLGHGASGLPQFSISSPAAWIFSRILSYSSTPSPFCLQNKTAPPGTSTGICWRLPGLCGDHATSVQPGVRVCYLTSVWPCWTAPPLQGCFPASLRKLSRTSWKRWRDG